jgi:hypothetical protein
VINLTDKNEECFTFDECEQFDTPTYTQDVFEYSNRMLKRIKELELPNIGFDDYKRNYTADELEALRYIQMDEEVPQDLADRIIQYHKDNPRPKSNYKTKTLPAWLISIILWISSVCDVITGNKYEE